MNFREIIGIDRERGWALFFRDKREREEADAVRLQIARQEAVAALDRTTELSHGAKEALAEGAPVDDPRVVAFREAANEASEALQRWLALGIDSRAL